MAAWVKRFPDEFYENVYRLKGWTWPGMSKNRYSVVGHYTNGVIFERLAPGLKDELNCRNPKDEKGTEKTSIILGSMSLEIICSRSRCLQCLHCNGRVYVKAETDGGSSSE